jgi:RimJ/RimL family protein N-acetyltransferase
MHEGTLREYEMNNGKLIDLMKFALLKSDMQH